jgi:hypothetical protein
MRKVLVALAQSESKIFSVGCDLGMAFLTEETLPRTAGGYIQIMCANYADRLPDDYAKYAAAVAHTLNAASKNHEWEVNFVLTPVAFKLDGYSDMTGSLWIWFHAFAEGAEAALHSREALIAELGFALTNARNTSLLETAG